MTFFSLILPWSQSSFCFGLKLETRQQNKPNRKSNKTEKTNINCTIHKSSKSHKKKQIYKMIWWSTYKKVCGSSIRHPILEVEFDWRLAWTIDISIKKRKNLKSWKRWVRWFLSCQATILSINPSNHQSQALGTKFNAATRHTHHSSSILF